METDRTAFNWTAWYASIPGIPDDWGKAPERKPASQAMRLGRAMVRLRGRPILA